MFVFCKYTATAEIYTYGHPLSLPDALPSFIAHLPLFGFSMQRTRRATAVWQWGGGHCERSEAISSSRPALSMAGDCFVAPLLAMTKGELRAVAEIIA